MELALPPGVHTLQTAADAWTRPDNVWRSHSDTDPLISCDVVAELRPPITDHLPIATEMELPVACTSSPPRKNFLDVDWGVFQTSLSEKLFEHLPARRITDEADFNSTVTLLTEIIQEVIADDEIVPWKKPCAFSKRWWSKDLSELKKQHSQASNEAHKFRHIQGHPSKAKLAELSRALANAIDKRRNEHWTSWLENIDARQIYLANNRHQQREGQSPS
ncbi:hypothetical protein FPV67DRAFT_1566062 [Lyophyllum atratum]|nr:hypothetical protein FPV67DRAFT_1566062 [Lyophyllum atratum]